MGRGMRLGGGQTHLLHDRTCCGEREALPAVLGRNQCAQEAARGELADKLGRVGALAVRPPPVLAGEPRA